MAQLGRTLCVKGEVTGSEDLKIDGRVEGRVVLPEHTVTVEPNATIEAEIVAKAVVVFGSIRGAVTVREKLEIRRTGSIVGTVVCGCLSIHEGAHLQGKVEMVTQPARSEKAKTAAVVGQLAAAV